MSKAYASHLEQRKCQAFKAWALEKGVDNLKKGRLKDHLLVFEIETEVRIAYFLAHVLFARLMRQYRRARERNRRHF